MWEKNKPYIFYIIIIIMLFAATLYMAQQIQSSLPAVKEVKEATTLKDVAVLSLMYTGIIFCIYGIAYHIHCAYKGIELFNHTKIRKKKAKQTKIIIR